ncbi:MmgE/PrpD family protein [Candidimonas nitroreducens]|uniref:2-methylcitrate dehydratase n=1 Tax=Candidimonas nitroreducens TaxID=683354 RepID=A0A225MIU7_9BURK|nr:MmgE/PrpD family protein [Candidimonas nitroreducens]OWT60243.1 2-methylcitrate dehydratase [Candidimonas nitroreducens]
MLLEEISRYGAWQGREALPPEVLHHAKRAVLDWLSALYPGTRVAPALQLVQSCAEELGSGRSRLPGRGATVFAATAAWINGSASHAVEFDDIFKDAVYHPGCPVISAALAVADQLDASGEDMLRAIVAGYEISTRIGAAVQPSHYRYFHTTGTVGCLGAAAATAALCAPGDAAVMGHAIATAATFASGLQQAFRSESMTKALHAGHAAEVGVRAGLAARAGVTGAPDILEGAAGFGAALSDGANWSRALEGLGTEYNITRITQKNYACCGHTFAAIDAALAVRDEHGLAPRDMRKIRVDTYQVALDVTGNFSPTTVFEAKFSLPYVVAHGLLYGSVRLDAFGPDHLGDAALRELMAKIELHADPALTAAFPAGRGARVRIETASGAEHEQLFPYRKGDPQCPLSDAELEAKYRELVAPVLGAEAAQRLNEQVRALERLPVRELALG